MEDIFAGVLIIAVLAVTIAVWAFDTVGAEKQKENK